MSSIMQILRVVCCCDVPNSGIVCEPISYNPHCTFYSQLNSNFGAGSV